MPDFAYSLLGFFRELKQPISINIDSFIKLLKINDVTSIINAFFSADAFATNNFSLKTKPQKPLQHNFIINQKLHKDAIKVAQVLAESETFARTLIATPSNLLNANHLEEICRSKFRKLNNVNISVLHKNDLVRKKMGLILAVGQASPKHNEPRIVVIQYHGDPKKERLAFVGKGLMFDTGGLNLKPSDAMNMMHMDMAGAAITIGTIYALAKLNVKTNVVGVLAITSNEIGPHAYRVNDVVKAYSGSTVEIVNTDAEGRLALADAITYAKKDLKANTVMTVATLTGAIVIALGNVMSGI
jgi:leucyl aminopeptidase